MNILMINHDQFGHSTGYYHYCKHLLAKGHNILYLCKDEHMTKVECSGINVYYVDEHSGYRWRREFGHIVKTILQQNDIDIVLCSYYKGCSLLRYYIKNIPIILDVRTGSVNKSIVKRGFYNWLIRCESCFFSRIMILSESLAEKLELKRGNYDIIPLGADVYCADNKDFSKIKMLYVGTLRQRDIHKTIKGLYKFILEYPNSEIEYDIVGFGSVEEEGLIKDLIKKYGLENIIKFHGRINYDKLAPFYQKANLGVAFVPQTPYYDCQPSTKIYEYALSGIYTIATSTKENRRLITHQNGLLCEDSVESFYIALKSYHIKYKYMISSTTIRESLAEYEWANIVGVKLLGLLCRVKK